MNIVMLFTPQGQVMGERVDAEWEDTIRLRKPVLVVPNPNGVQMVPLFAMTTDDSYEINASALLFKGAYTPDPQLAAGYSKQFGVIQIAQSLATFR